MKKPPLVFSLLLVILLQTGLSENSSSEKEKHKLRLLFQSPRQPAANIHLTLLRKRNTTNTTSSPTQHLSVKPRLKTISFSSRRPSIMKMKPIKDQVKRPKLKTYSYPPRKSKSKYSIKFRNILHRSKMGRFQKNINEAKKKHKYFFL